MPYVLKLGYRVLLCVVVQLAANSAGSAQPAKGVKLKVANDTGSEISIFYLKNDEPVFYKKLAPSQSYEQDTFTGHRWCATIVGRDHTPEFVVPVAETAAWHVRDTIAKYPHVIDGELTAKDPFDKVRKESWAKVYELELKAGEIYVIDLRSDDFDTFLRLEGRQVHYREQ